MFYKLKTPHIHDTISFKRTRICKYSYSRMANFSSVKGTVARQSWFDKNNASYFFLLEVPDKLNLQNTNLYSSCDRTQVSNIGVTWVGASGG